MSVIMCFLSVYGVFRLLYSVVMHLSGNKKLAAGDIHKIIAANDESTALEGYLRTELMSDNTTDVIVVDLSTTDEMKKLLKAVESEFSFVTVMSRSEYLNYIEAFG